MFIINTEGIVVDLDIVPANTDDRETLKNFNLKSCTLLGDKGFLSQELKEDLRIFNNLNLITPPRKNAKNPNKLPALFSKTRRLIETVIGQFTERFNIQKHKAKDLWHLASRIYRKVLSHTISIIRHLS
jgi:mitochondrial fission protein ELM1